jgi:hypothetical protein
MLLISRPQRKLSILQMTWGFAEQHTLLQRSFVRPFHDCHFFLATIGKSSSPHPNDGTTTGNR